MEICPAARKIRVVAQENPVSVRLQTRQIQKLPAERPIHLVARQEPLEIHLAILPPPGPLAVLTPSQQIPHAAPSSPSGVLPPAPRLPPAPLPLPTETGRLPHPGLFLPRPLEGVAGQGPLRLWLAKTSREEVPLPAGAGEIPQSGSGRQDSTRQS